MDAFFLKQVVHEGKLRYRDGEYLDTKRNGDSGYLLRLLGFELLLKAVLYYDKKQEDYSHNYYAVYCTLSRPLKQVLLSEAQKASQIFDIKDRIENLLKWYEYNFVRLRYPFQSYKSMSESEYQGYSDLYTELGCPDGEAEFEYYPEELRGLFLALEAYLDEK
ncbi:MAG: hypothetical protein ACRBB6_03675 [Neptuniibacter sp.]